MLREVLRRVRNFLIGPKWAARHVRQEWTFQWGVVPYWLSSEGWHFTEVGVRLFWFSHVFTLAWVDNN